MSKFTDFARKYGVLILAVVVLILAISSVAYHRSPRKERFVTCAVQPADIIEGDIQLSIHDKEKLLGKCLSTNKTKDAPYGAIPISGDKFTQAEIDQQEMKCMTSCYPGMYLDITGKSQKVCVDECKVPTSADCQKCVTDFHCMQSEGGNSGMPCQSQSIAIPATTDQEIQDLVQWETE
jgi:hypothetical protein